MVGILDHSTGVTREQAAAAVLLFRAGTVLFGAFLGGLVYFFGWRGTAEAKKSKETPEAAAASTPVPAPAAEVLR
jgi:uncharacterized membrane protein YbhN (UPF0104 family)